MNTQRRIYEVALRISEKFVKRSAGNRLTLSLTVKTMEDKMALYREQRDDSNQASETVLFAIIYVFWRRSCLGFQHADLKMADKTSC